MCPENNKSQSNIETFVEDKLTKVEKEICAFVEKEYPELKIMVSIQVLHSSQANYRNNPCNKKCDAVQQDSDKLAQCNRSDQAMKIILWQQIMGRQAPGGEMKGIGYHCHQNLSNIVIPLREKLLEKKWYWYIFLGQFYLKACSVTSGDQGCPDGFATEQIKILTNDRIPVGFSECIRPGFFCNQETLHDAQALNVSFLTIPQFLICRYIALRHFRNFLHTLKDDELIKFKSWLEMYAKPRKEDFKTLKSAAID